jgi:hypothetical protein
LYCTIQYWRRALIGLVPRFDSWKAAAAIAIDDSTARLVRANLKPAKWWPFQNPTGLMILLSRYESPRLVCRRAFCFREQARWLVVRVLWPTRPELGGLLSGADAKYRLAETGDVRCAVYHPCFLIGQGPESGLPSTFGRPR